MYIEGSGSILLLKTGRGAIRNEWVLHVYGDTHRKLLPPTLPEIWRLTVGIPSLERRCRSAGFCCLFGNQEVEHSSPDFRCCRGGR